MVGIRFKVPLKDRVCFNCNGKTTTIRKNGSPVWHIIDNHSWCHLCWMRVIYNPVHNKITNPKRVQYKDKRRFVNGKAKLTGKCDVCKKSIGDEYINHKGEIAIIKLTHTHHKAYHDTDILKDTIEICASCHGKENKGKKHKE